MAKTVNYFISGVWKNNSDDITHVLLHTVNHDGSFQYGVKTTELTAINLLKQRNIIKTITWGYPNWKIGTLVTYVNNNNREYLRTKANATLKDNLDNSINMQAIRT